MQLLTSLLELAGLLLITVGIWLAIAVWLTAPPIAFVAAGICFIGISYLVTRRGGRR